jgi:hypothetical protein
VAKIGGLRNWHGHNGWKFDQQRYGTPSYEVGLFKGYQDGSAIGKWGVPDLPILRGNDRDGREVNIEHNMFVLSRDRNSAFRHTFLTGRSLNAKYSQTCMEGRPDFYGPGLDRSDFVQTVYFEGGVVILEHKANNQACVRPVVALELNRLVL